MGVYAMPAPLDSKGATSARNLGRRPLIRQLRLISVAEASSYVALLVATAAKQLGFGGIGVTVLGPVHGVLYLAFVAAVAWRREWLGWPWARALTAMIIGSLPLGGFWLERNWLAPLDRSRRAPDRSPTGG